MEIKSTRDLKAGMRIGKVVLLERSVEHSRGMWTARCDCGTVFKRTASSFANGRDTTSCDKCRHWSVKGSGTDGDGSLKSKYNRLYQMWQNMHGRCEKDNYFEYAEYGARGIKVCDEWTAYIPFKKWAIANGYDCDAPVRSQTIDRIDVNGNYSPDNCRFLNVKEQSQNRRNNVFVEYKGRKQTLMQWADELDLEYRSLQYRHNKLGLRGEELFAFARKRVPDSEKGKRGMHVLVNDTSMTILEAADALKVSDQTIRRWVRAGKLEKAS